MKIRGNFVVSKFTNSAPVAEAVREYDVEGLEKTGYAVRGETKATGLCWYFNRTASPTEPDIYVDACDTWENAERTAKAIAG